MAICEYVGLCKQCGLSAFLLFLFLFLFFQSKAISVSCIFFSKAIARLLFFSVKVSNKIDVHEYTVRIIFSN